MMFYSVLTTDEIKEEIERLEKHLSEITYKDKISEEQLEGLKRAYKFQTA